LKELMAAHRNGNAAATILSACSPIQRAMDESAKVGADGLGDCRESQLTTSSARLTKSIGDLLLHTGETLARLAQVKPNNKHRELYLTDANRRAERQGRKPVLRKWPPISREVLGCNTRADLARSTAYFGAETQRIDGRWRHHPVAGEVLIDQT